MGGPRITTKERDRIQQLHKNGYTPRQIAKRIGRSFQGVANIIEGKVQRRTTATKAPIDTYGTTVTINTDRTTASAIAAVMTSGLTDNLKLFIVRRLIEGSAYGQRRDEQQNLSEGHRTEGNGATGRSEWRVRSQTEPTFS